MLECREVKKNHTIFLNLLCYKHLQISYFLKKILSQPVNTVVEVICVQSHLTVYNPMDCSLPGSFAHGIFLARILASWSRDWTCILYMGKRMLYHCVTWEAEVIMTQQLIRELFSLVHNFLFHILFSTLLEQVLTMGKDRDGKEV